MKIISRLVHTGKYIYKNSLLYEYEVRKKKELVRIVPKQAKAGYSAVEDQTLGKKGLTKFFKEVK